MRTLAILLAVTWAAAVGATDVEMLSYSTFIDYVEEGVVRSVNIYNIGEVEIEAVIEKDGQEQTVLVKDPTGMKGDLLLHKFLKENGVVLAILSQDYSGDYPDRGRMEREMLWITVVMLLIPGALIVSILVLLIVILLRVQSIHSVIKAFIKKE